MSSVDGNKKRKEVIFHIGYILYLCARACVFVSVLYSIVVIVYTVYCIYAIFHMCVRARVCSCVCYIL